MVIGCNFCPFAANVIRRAKVYYRVEPNPDRHQCMNAVLLEAERLDQHPEIETSFLIFSNACVDFESFLDLLQQAEQKMHQNGYTGVYQLASFHPLYRFAGSDEPDPANYTNRSLYPMLHFLRENSIEIALENYSSPEKSPSATLLLPTKKGLIICVF